MCKLISGGWKLSYKISSRALSKKSAFELICTIITIIWEGTFALVVQVEESIFCLV